MLKKFQVKGFQQFQDLTLDFGNVRDYDFSTQCLTRNRKLLKTILVYGPNASGKSNLGFALFDIFWHLFDRVTPPEVCACYLNADSGAEAAEFSYEFAFPRSKPVIYEYRKTSPNVLISEKLIYGEETVFSWDARTGVEDFSNLGKFGLASQPLPHRGRGLSFLRCIASDPSLEPGSPVKKVMDFAGSMLWFRKAGSVNSSISQFPQPESIDRYLVEQHLVQDFERFLNEHGVAEKLTVRQSPDGRQTLCLDHQRPIPFSLCASGCTVLLSVFFYWRTFFGRASFIFIDDFDTCCPARVAESVFEELSRLNRQVVLTAHGTNLLDHRRTRPDCCFEISRGCLKSLADRTNRILRQGNNLEKLYRAGEFSK